MVLGLRSKNRKRSSIQVDYLIHVQEIKPWPPAKSVQSLLLHWENGDQSSGSLTSGVGDGKVHFNESFRLPVTLCWEVSKKGIARDSFLKNFLEFYFYEAVKGNAVKGQLLGSAVANLADYGIIKEAIAISIPINFKKSSRNTVQPILYLTIEPLSPKGTLSKEVSLDNDGSGSFSEFINEEECEIASFTDDDNASSHSSRANSSSAVESVRSSPAQSYKNGSESTKDGVGRVNWEPALLSSVAPAKQEVNPEVEALESFNGSSSSSSTVNLSSNLENPVNNPAVKVASSNVGINKGQVWLENSPTNPVNDKKTWRQDKSGPEEATTSNIYVGLSKDKDKKEQQENGQHNQTIEMKRNSVDNKLVFELPQEPMKKEVNLRSNTLANSRTSVGAQSGTSTNNKLKHVKSVQLHANSVRSNGMLGNSQYTGKEKEVGIAKDIHNGGMKNAETTNGFCDSKVKLESKIEMLEEELKEAAAVEVGLYSIVAEHGSSTNKVHAPARRLSRFYLHACTAPSQAKRASAARTAISGLVLISKACGNDVPRLTFWLSNSVVLRAIVSQGVGNNNENCKGLEDSSDDWEDPQTFIVALEKLEAWIFSRIIESVWWQTLTPHMQAAAAKNSSSRKPSGRRYGFGDLEQGQFSIDLWKKAFKDACERLCPIRAGGHECGCLPVLAKVIMEQLVGRLDVAMFNAILRESADEMPTDPVSDPISDSKVLPIPAGRSSFGAGAQLKNAVGDWSRWLTDLFGIDDNDHLEDMNEVCEDKSVERETTFKAFPLLNALSDLMMLPFEMLADNSTRKEVCPTFGAPLIKRVLYNFVPDEFNPDPIPDAVFQALDSEDDCEAEDGSLSSFPCTARPIIYSPPPAASLTGVIGKVGSQALQRSESSAVLRKSYTSDDELDELDSPLTSIITDNSRASSTSAAPNWMPKGKGGRKVVRYQLLREVWKDDKY